MRTEELAPRSRTDRRCATLEAAAQARSYLWSSRAAHAARPVHGLRMLAARFGDAAQCAPRAGRAVGQGDVAEREDSHQALFVVEHGQPAKLDVGHILHDVVEVIVPEAGQ